MPYNDYFEYYGPEYRLHMPVSNMENLNDRPYLEDMQRMLCEQLRNLENVPSVPFHQVPRAIITDEFHAEDDDPAAAESNISADPVQQPQHAAEFYD